MPKIVLHTQLYWALGSRYATDSFALQTGMYALHTQLWWALGSR